MASVIILFGQLVTPSNWICAQDSEQVDSSQTDDHSAREAPLASLRLIADLNYAGNDNPRQTLDLLLPQSPQKASPLPVIVWIHGGAWRAGDKGSGHRRLAEYVKTGNYAGACIGYRLSKEAIWPAQIHDCKAAIRWLRAHAKQYGMDPAKIAAWGSSAGGHLVAMLGVSHGVEELEGNIGSHADEQSHVSCVIDFFGPTDFLRMNDFPGKMNHDAPDSPESQLVGGEIQKNKAAVAMANPITFVTADDSPFLLVHGTKDQLVPLNQSELLRAALRQAGVESAFIQVENAGHGFSSSKVDQRVAAFLQRHLLGGDGTFQDETVSARRR